MLVIIEKVIELLGAGLGLYGIFLSTKGLRSSWIFSILSILFSMVLFYRTGIYGQVLLHIVFFGTSVFGYLKWSSAGDAPIYPKELSASMKAIAAVIVALATAAIYPLLSYLGEALPSADAFVIGGSLVATFLMAQKYKENWYLWIPINIIAMALFAYAGLWSYVLLYGTYVLLSFKGIIEWNDLQRGGSTI